MFKDIDGSRALVVLTLLAQACFILLHLGTEWHRFDRFGRIQQQGGVGSCSWPG